MAQPYFFSAEGRKIWPSPAGEKVVAGVRCGPCRAVSWISELGAGSRKRIWLNELAHIHARYQAQAIKDNSKWAREGCLVGKSAEARAPQLSGNNAALPLGSGY